MIGLRLRERYLLEYALASLLRRKGKNIGLLAVYALLVFVLASVLMYTHALRSEASAVLAHAPEVVVQRMVAGRHDPMRAEALATLRAIRGVGAVEGRLWGYYFDSGVGANYTVMVPPSDAPPAGDIVIGAGVARLRGLAPGDYLSLRRSDGTSFTPRIATVLDQTTELVSTDLVLLAESDFRALFGVPDELFTDIALRVRNPREVRVIAEKIVSALPDTRPILREEIERTYQAIFDWRGGTVLVLLTGALLAFAILAWDKASGLSAEERREIGILKAIGWETSDVLRMKLLEGGAVSLAAFLLGYLGAYLHIFYARAVLFEPALKGWAVLYPSFRPLPSLEPTQLVTLLMITALPYALATVVPVWRAAISDPDAVMR
jgi:cell division protein FtsX